MAKFIAIHQLHLASAVKGVTDVINPREQFESIESDGVDRLKEIGAIRKATEADSGAVKAVRASAKGNTAPAAPVSTETDLTKLKKADLIALAKKEEIEVDEAGTNAELIKAIEDGRAAKNDSLV